MKISRLVSSTLAALITITFSTTGLHASAHLEVLKAFPFPDLLHDNDATQFAPRDGLLEGSDGILYGTTTRLSAESAGPGAVFKINKDGTGYTVLHSFERSRWHGRSCCGGAIPGRLIEGSDHFLYGVSCCWLEETEQNGAVYAAEVFKLSRDGGTFTQLHRFTDVESLMPNRELVQGEDGRLYGSACCTYTGNPLKPITSIYSLNPDGSDFAFNQTIAGDASYAMTAGRDGAIYISGRDVARKAASIFRLDLRSNTLQLLREFPVGTNVLVELGRLLHASDGLLYGTLLTEGDPLQPGITTVFRLRTDGTELQILSIPEPEPPDALLTISPLTEGQDGLLYGVLNSVEKSKVFRLKKDGTEYRELLSAFNEPEVFGRSAIILGSDHALYGAGGFAGGGIIFKVSPPELAELRIVHGAKSDSLILLNVSGAPGARYQLFRSPDLKSWALERTFTMSMTGSELYAPWPADPASFFRVLWLP